LALFNRSVALDWNPATNAPIWKKTGKGEKRNKQAAVKKFDNIL